LGTFMVLWLVRRALALDLPHVYLGYWVPQSRKMAYKAAFSPVEILWGGQWRTLTEAEVETGPAPPIACAQPISAG
jgi:arginine-tRNA-protein transferase